MQTAVRNDVVIRHRHRVLQQSRQSRRQRLNRNPVPHQRRTTRHRLHAHDIVQSLRHQSCPPHNAPSREPAQPDLLTLRRQSITTTGSLQQQEQMSGSRRLVGNHIIRGVTLDASLRHNHLDLRRTQTLQKDRLLAVQNGHRPRDRHLRLCPHALCPRNAVIPLGKRDCLADMNLLSRDQFLLIATRRDG